METDKDIINMAISNFDHIREISERLTSGNVTHQGRTIMGIALRNVKYLKDYLTERNNTNQEMKQRAIKAFVASQKDSPRSGIAKRYVDRVERDIV